MEYTLEVWYLPLEDRSLQGRQEDKLPKEVKQFQAQFLL